MTGLDLVSAALRKIGVLAAGETPEAQESADALAEANRMIRSWSNEQLMIPYEVEDTLTLVAGTQSYTMGTGATLNTDRPIGFSRAVTRSTVSTPPVDYPVNIRTAEEWASIPVKTLAAEIITDLYPQGTYPNETLKIWPVPTVAHSLVIWSWKELSQIASLATTLSLPAGYEDAMVYTLAVRLAPDYGRPVSDIVSSIAVESKAAIKRTNHRPSYLKVDAALRARGTRFNIYKGDST